MVQQGKHRIKIEAKPNGLATIELDGEDVSKNCVGYSIAHEAGTYAVVELRYKYWGSAEFNGTVEMSPTGFVPHEQMEDVYGPPQEGKS